MEFIVKCAKDHICSHPSPVKKSQLGTGRVGCEM